MRLCGSPIEARAGLVLQRTRVSLLAATPLLHFPHSLMTARESSNNLGSRRRVVEGAGPQRPTGPVGADDDARGRSLRADEREFAWRGSIRKDTFACA